jgi:hypothetical protein
MKLITVFAILLIVVWIQTASAQPKARIDLDDMMIKGELHNDDRLMILARQKNELKNYIKFRTSFREEMLQELPIPRQKKNY